MYNNAAVVAAITLGTRCLVIIPVPFTGGRKHQPHLETLWYNNVIELTCSLKLVVYEDDLGLSNAMQRRGTIACVYVIMYPGSTPCVKLLYWLQICSPSVRSTANSHSLSFSSRLSICFLVKDLNHSIYLCLMCCSDLILALRSPLYSCLP